jgi:hypothetical protein
MQIPEIFRIMSQKQLRDGDDEDESTIRAGNIRPFPVDSSLDDEDEKKQCCNI